MSLSSHNNTQNLNTHLLQAIKNSSLIDVRNIIAQGANINPPGHFSKNPLWLAIQLGKLDIAKDLIDQGANLYWGHQETALIDACQGGYIPMADYLVREKNMDIHQYNETALMRAIINDQYLMVKWLVKEGANIHIDNDKAFALAQQYDRMDILNFLNSDTTYLSPVIYKSKPEVVFPNALQYGNFNSSPVKVVKYSLENIYSYSFDELKEFIARMTTNTYNDLQSLRYMTLYYLYFAKLLNFKDTELIDLCRVKEDISKIFKNAFTITDLRNKLNSLA